MCGSNRSAFCQAERGKLADSLAILPNRNLQRGRARVGINLHGARHAGHHADAIRYLIDVDAHRNALRKPTQVKIGFTEASPAESGCTFGMLMPRATPPT